MKIIEETALRFNETNYLQTNALDASFYTDPGIFDLEKDRIFNSSWHMVCRVEDISEQGDYFCDEYLGEKIFVLNCPDGKIRAFANVCRHRWSTLLEGQGKIDNGGKAIVCPYHRWCYSFEGKLIGAPDIEDLEQFSPDTVGLHKVRCQIWCDFVFINLSNESDDLETVIGGYGELMEPYHNELKCIRRTQYEINANWKGYIEVDMETYHTPSVHSGSIGVQTIEVVKPDAQYIGVYHPSETTVALRPEERHLGFPHIDGLNGKQSRGTYFCVLLPSLFIVNTLDAMWWIYKVPKAVNKTEVRCGFCFPKTTIERPDFTEIAKRYFDRWDTVIEEDNWIVEKQYQGILSKAFSTPGRYAGSESVVFDFDKWVISKLT